MAEATEESHAGDEELDDGVSVIEDPIYYDTFVYPGMWQYSLKDENELRRLRILVGLEEYPDVDDRSGNEESNGNGSNNCNEVENADEYNGRKEADGNFVEEEHGDVVAEEEKEETLYYATGGKEECKQYEVRPLLLELSNVDYTAFTQIQDTALDQVEDMEIDMNQSSATEESFVPHFESDTCQSGSSGFSGYFVCINSPSPGLVNVAGEYLQQILVVNSQTKSNDCDGDSDTSNGIVFAGSEATEVETVRDDQIGTESVPVYQQDLTPLENNPNLSISGPEHVLNGVILHKHTEASLQELSNLYNGILPPELFGKINTVEEMLERFPILLVACNGFTAYLHKERFISGKDGHCIKIEIEGEGDRYFSWMTPSEYEVNCGYPVRNIWTWKYSITCQGLCLQVLINKGWLQSKIPGNPDLCAPEDWSEIGKHHHPNASLVKLKDLFPDEEEAEKNPVENTKVELPKDQYSVPPWRMSPSVNESWRHSESRISVLAESNAIQNAPVVQFGTHLFRLVQLPRANVEKELDVQVYSSLQPDCARPIFTLGDYISQDIQSNITY